MRTVTVTTITGEQLSGVLLDLGDEEKRDTLDELFFTLGIQNVSEFEDYIFLERTDGVTTILETNEIQSITANFLLNYQATK